MKIIRVLVYEGSEKWLQDTAWCRRVKGKYSGTSPKGDWVIKEVLMGVTGGLFEDIVAKTVEEILREKEIQDAD